MKVIKWLIQLRKKLMKYFINNTGSNTPINYSSSVDQPWISVIQPTGLVLPNSGSAVHVVVNSFANTLMTGTYVGKVYFLNTTSGVGNTSRNVTLIVTSVGQMYVTPASDAVFTGSFGGPFG
jgi:hypothetical protein